MEKTAQRYDNTKIIPCRKRSKRLKDSYRRKKVVIDSKCLELLSASKFTKIFSTGTEYDAGKITNIVNNYGDRVETLSTATDTNDDTHANVLSIVTNEGPKDFVPANQEKDKNKDFDKNLIQSWQCVPPKKWFLRTRLSTIFPEFPNGIQVSSPMKNSDFHNGQTEESAFDTYTRKEAWNRVDRRSDQTCKRQIYAEKFDSRKKNSVMSHRPGFSRISANTHKSLPESDIDVDRLIEVLMTQKFDPRGCSMREWKLITQEYYNTRRIPCTRKCTRLYNFYRKWKLLIHSKMKELCLASENSQAKSVNAEISKEHQDTTDIFSKGNTGFLNHNEFQLSSDESETISSCRENDDVEKLRRGTYSIQNAGIYPQNMQDIKLDFSEYGSHKSRKVFSRLSGMPRKEKHAVGLQIGHGSVTENMSPKSMHLREHSPFALGKFVIDHPNNEDFETCLSTVPVKLDEETFSSAKMININLKRVPSKMNCTHHETFSRQTQHSRFNHLKVIRFDPLAPAETTALLLLVE